MTYTPDPAAVEAMCSAWAGDAWTTYTDARKELLYVEAERMLVALVTEGHMRVESEYASTERQWVLMKEWAVDYKAQRDEAVALLRRVLHACWQPTDDGALCDDCEQQIHAFLAAQEGDR